MTKFIVVWLIATLGAYVGLNILKKPAHIWLCGVLTMVVADTVYRVI
jgi:hypothetical protein